MKKDPNRIVYIYSLNDPMDNSIKYIGWCFDMKARIRGHLYESKGICGYTKKNSWIRELLDKNIKPTINIIENTMYKDHEEREKYWIKYYGRKNLVNSTDGGDKPVEIEYLDPFDMNKNRLLKRLTYLFYRGYSKEKILEIDLGMRYDIKWKDLSFDEKQEYLKNELDLDNPFLQIEEDELRTILMDYNFHKRFFFMEE